MAARSALIVDLTSIGGDLFDRVLLALCEAFAAELPLAIAFVGLVLALVGLSLQVVHAMEG